MLRLSILAALCAVILCSDPEADMKVPEIIAHWGYPSESMQLFTDDGYELTMHRIPYGKGQDPNKKRPIMFLQHGLLASSSTWITNLPSLSLGFMAADAGFDVWMGNVRGNLYSIGHKTLDPKSHEYWKFSWDEMVAHDVPSMINHALNVTGEKDLYYIGHSQGTLIMFSHLANNPEFGAKIKQFHAVAPVGTVKHIQGLLSFVAKDFYLGFEFLEKVLGEDQFLPEDSFVHLAAELFCKNPLIESMCGNVLFLIAGPESHQMNVTRLDVFLSDEPAGTSTQNILHWAQMVRSGLQNMFDYENKKTNEQHYGQDKPPVYDIKKIATPMYLYWSDADWLADAKDVEEHLLKDLNSQYLVESNRLHDFNHLDFVWGQRAGAEVNTPIINAVRNDLAKSNRKL